MNRFVKIIMLSLILLAPHIQSGEGVLKPATLKKFNTLLDNKTPTVLFVGTSWCGACKKFKPVFNVVALEKKDIQFIFIDGDNKKEFDPLFEILSISAYPTLIFYDDSGTIVHTNKGGLKEQAFKDMINEHLANDFLPAEPIKNSIASKKSKKKSKKKRSKKKK